MAELPTDARPDPQAIGDVVADAIHGAYPAEMSDGIAEAIQAERDHYEARIRELEQAAEARERELREVLVRMRDETRLLDMGPWKTVDFWASELGIDLGEGKG